VNISDGTYSLAEQEAKHKLTKDNVALPPLGWLESPNQSDRRLAKGIAPFLIVIHRPVGPYHASMAWLDNPKAQASAHIVTEGNFTKVDEATQLVPWHRKAWACMSFNSISYNLEIDDDAWFGRDPGALLVAHRIAAWLCWKTGIPAKRSLQPLHNPGIISHFLLGQAGGGHTDPSEDPAVLARFIKGTQYQLHRGHFRKAWGRGTLRRI